MRSLKRSLLAAVCVFAALTTALSVEPASRRSTADAQPAPHIRTLIVTGVDHKAHLWQKTSPCLRKMLEKDGRFQVEVATDPDVLADAKLLDFDLLVLHFKNYAPLPREEQARANLLKYLAAGKGLALIHFASGAFEDWPQFADIAGKVWDRKTSHDPRGPFTVHIINHDHPITHGMSDFATDDELYVCLVGSKPVEVLATARSKRTGKDHPLAFVHQCGSARVFHTPLGHDVKALEMPGAEQLIVRGCAWSAGREP